jgi:exopolyphosphatase/guanosine-5'-triphosphate,3'-diphosphate pyrophosphatase
MRSRQASPNTRSTAAGGPVGVIDIGSNSVRLVIYDRLNRNPVPIYNEKSFCALAKGLEKSGRLDAEGTEKAVAALGRFAAIAGSMPVARLFAFATAAIRDAEDGAAFVARVKRESGLSIDILSGQDEARLSALGVRGCLPNTDGIMGDLGGGSLELVTLKRDTIGRYATLPLGPLRLAAYEADRPQLVKRIDQHLSDLNWLADGKGRTFHPVGGAWRALASAHIDKTNYPLHIIQNYAIPGAEAMEFAGLIAKQSLSSLLRSPSVSKKRAEHLPLAALVMERVLRRVQPSQVVFSSHGLREGIFYQQLSEAELKRDPLIVACEELSLTRQTIPQAQRLCAWVAPIFPQETPAEARLRYAAALVSFIGWFEHPDYRAEHAYLRILRMPFSGIDHRERAMLALTVRVRYGGGVDRAPDAVTQRLLSERDLEWCNRLGLALRLGLTVCGGAVDLLEGTGLAIEKSKLVLTVGADRADLIAEKVLARFENLAKLIGLATGVSILSDARRKRS